MAHKSYPTLEWHLPPLKFTLAWLTSYATFGRAPSSSNFNPRVAYKRYATLNGTFLL